MALQGAELSVLGESERSSLPQSRLPGVPDPKGSVLFTYQEQEEEMLPGQSHLSWTNTFLLHARWHWMWMPMIMNAPLMTRVHIIF